MVEYWHHHEVVAAGLPHQNGDVLNNVGGSQLLQQMKVDLVVPLWHYICSPALEAVSVLEGATV